MEPTWGQNGSQKACKVASKICRETERGNQRDSAAREVSPGSGQPEVLSNVSSKGLVLLYIHTYIYIYIHIYIYIYIYKVIIN